MQNPAGPRPAPSRLRAASIGLLIAGAMAPHATGQENPFDAPVLDVRPRVFIRRDAFDGLTVDKIRRAAQGKDLAALRGKWRARPLGRAILWMLDGKRDDLDAAVAGLRTMDATGGSWSDRGLSLVRLATLFDWLFPELDGETRKQTIARIEQAADAAVAHVRGGRAPFFYSRTPGALAGLAVSGIALKGVSPKAADYLACFRRHGVDDYFQAYRWVDGAATGATYTFYYTYVDLPQVCAAWWSATGKNPADWIRETQGDWLDGIVRFHLWYLRPGFAFTDINDQSRDIWGTHDQFCQGLDIATYVTRNGHGRSWSQRWLGRFGPALYHSAYAHNAIFRDPSVEAKPLTGMPKAALFGRESCGYGFFRSGWPAPGEPDAATHVFFRAGDPMDVHGGLAAGEFQVFRHAPLAARSGRYQSYDSPPDQYHRHAVSANVVLFTDPARPGDRGDQNTRRGLKTDHRTWADWLAIRERCGLDVADITAWEVTDGSARCRADLSRTNPPEKCRQWIREFVWLADRHLVVLDVVETATPAIRRRWQLHAPTAPRIGDRLVTIVNRPPKRSWAEAGLRPAREEARLHCRTLLPKTYTLRLHADGKARAFGPNGSPGGDAEGDPHHLQYGDHVLQVDPGGASARTVFLHVLTAVDADAEAPAAGYRVIGPGRIEVEVDGTKTALEVPDWFKG